MSPSISKSEYSICLLYNPKLRKIHIVDLVQIDDKYSHQMSDLTTSILVVSATCGVIQKTQACYCYVPLLIHVSLRKVYKHEGEAFLGLDRLAMTLFSQVFSGSKDILAGLYSLDNMESAPGYDEWLSNTLFRGKGKEDCDYKRHSLTPLKHVTDRIALTS
jgi:hypothetical protein